jgi:hypothetical protein
MKQVERRPMIQVPFTIMAIAVLAIPIMVSAGCVTWSALGIPKLVGVPTWVGPITALFVAEAIAALAAYGLGLVPADVREEKLLKEPE